MFRLLVSALAVVGLLALAAAFAQNSGRAEPAMTRSISELPPPEHLFYVDVAQAAPRSIPWDCSDWQESPAVADADDARVSMILESLAANRGKAIYCAIDQSDTWTKAETWAAGRDRNERDDTVYFGQSGNFRGFLAAQEGYLTDGESGVTGISRDRIFEFPEEPRRGKKTVIKRLRLTERVSHPTFVAAQLLGANPSDAQLNGTDDASNTLIENARSRWCTHASVGGSFTGPAYAACIHSYDWVSLAQPLAAAECIARGYDRLRAAITSADIVDPGYPDVNIPGRGRGHWEYHIPQEGQYYRIHARQFRLYNAVCEKKVRVRRR